MPEQQTTPQQDDGFNPAALLLLVPLAIAAWGRYVPKRYAGKPSERWLPRVIAGIKGEMRAVTRRFIDGDISRVEWERWMTEYQQIVYVLSTAVALETFELAAADFEVASEQQREQTAYLLGFFRQVADGEQKKNGSMLARAALYAAAGWSLVQAFKAIKARLFGYTEERRVLGIADHCPDCLRYAAMGWQPIGTLPVIGAGSVCRTHCHCHKEFR